MKKAFDIGKYHSNGKRIGSGAYSNVYKGVDMVSGDPVAIKVVDLFHLTSREPQKKDKLIARLKIEIRIAQETDHPNLVKMLDFFQEDEKVYLIFEFCDGGDFARFLKKRGALPEDEARFYLQQIVDGMSYLSKNNIIHRDLKPPNILLKEENNTGIGKTSKRYTLKIADFGFAKETEPDILSETICGSPLYMAPELLNRRPYSSKADLWSLGVILYEMVTGLQPVPAKSHLELVQNIQNLKIKIPAYLSKNCKSILMGLLRKKEEGRMTMAEVVSHPFLLDGSITPRGRSFSMPPRTKPIEIESTISTGSYICKPLETEPSMTFSPPSFSPPSFLSDPCKTMSPSKLVSPVLRSRRQPLWSGETNFDLHNRGGLASSPIDMYIQASTSLKIRNIYERFYGIEEVYQITLCSSDIAEIVYLYFLILNMLKDLMDIVKLKIDEKRLKPSRKLAKIIIKSIQRYKQVYSSISTLRKDICLEDKVPSFHEIIFRNVVALEEQSNDPRMDLKISYRCVNSAIILLLLLRVWSDEESINKETINYEIARFLKKKKILKTKASFSSSFAK